RHAGERFAELAVAPFDEVLDGARNELGLGGIVVKLGAPGESGASRDLGGSGSRVAEVAHALDSGVEETRLGSRAALGLGAPHPLGYCLAHATWPSRQNTYSQA